MYSPTGQGLRHVPHNINTFNPPKNPIMRTLLFDLQFTDEKFCK